MFNSDVSIGDVLTAAGVTIATASLLLAWAKDRSLNRTKYADRVRESAALTIAKIERWKQLSMSLFDAIQPSTVDADALLCREGNVIPARDLFWRELVTAKTHTSDSIRKESIETAYADLYGYDSRVHDLFSETIRRLRLIDDEMFNSLLERTQAAIVSLEKGKEGFLSAQLGNAVRQVCQEVACEAGRLMDSIVTQFRVEMLRIVEANDINIVNRGILIRPAEEVFAESGTNLGSFDPIARAVLLQVSSTKLGLSVHRFRDDTIVAQTLGVPLSCAPNSRLYRPERQNAGFVAPERGLVGSLCHLAAANIVEYHLRGELWRQASQPDILCCSSFHGRGSEIAQEWLEAMSSAVNRELSTSLRPLPAHLVGYNLRNGLYMFLNRCTFWPDASCAHFLRAAMIRQEGESLVFPDATGRATPPRRINSNALTEEHAHAGKRKKSKRASKRSAARLAVDRRYLRQWGNR